MEKSSSSWTCDSRDRGKIWPGDPKLVLALDICKSVDVHPRDCLQRENRRGREQSLGRNV